jgi:hypothetical protein
LLRLLSGTQNFTLPDVYTHRSHSAGICSVQAAGALAGGGKYCSLSFGWQVNSAGREHSTNGDVEGGSAVKIATLQRLRKYHDY